MKNQEKYKALGRVIEDLKKDSNVLAAFVFGSFARGTHRPDSDIDLLVVTKNPFEKKIFTQNSVEFEVFCNNKEDIAAFWRKNKDDFEGIRNDAKILFGDPKVINFLEEVARELSPDFKSFKSFAIHKSPLSQ